MRPAEADAHLTAITRAAKHAATKSDPGVATAEIAARLVTVEAHYVNRGVISYVYKLDGVQLTKRQLIFQLEKASL